PSGLALATVSPAIVPAAPGRLSITNVWPSTGRRFSAITRAVRSVLPPATNGTIILIDRLGQGWAEVSIGTSRAQPIAIRRILHMTLSSGGRDVTPEGECNPRRRTRQP